jgi:hypothetical protein
MGKFINEELNENFTCNHDMYIAGLHVGLRDDYAPANSKHKKHHD